jgi:steroid 5-alpha reductase family enzyme
MTVAMQGTTTTVSVLLTIGATAVPLVVAGAVTWYIARRQAGLRTVAQWLGLAVALVSVASALLAATELGTSIALSLMHVIAGIAWFVAVGRGRVS